MITVIFTSNGINYNRRAFTQWDYGQMLEIRGLELAEGVQIHFARKGLIAEVKTPTIDEEGNAVIEVPNSLLQYEGEFSVYVYKIEGNGGKTLKSVTFDIVKREKPEDYNPQEEINLTSTFIIQNTPSDDMESRLISLEDAVNKILLRDLGVL
jgi:hypothetical protein